MSSNYQRYPAMMQEVKRRRVANRPLRGQLEELLDVVRRCEARWALEERRREPLGS